ncbi:MAG: hypothetical protein Q9213_004598 [Squamulea squamosa]
MLPHSVRLPLLIVSQLKMDLNVVMSPLLQIPAELRDKIWTNVLGDRIVHLKNDRDKRRPPIHAHVSPDKVGLVQKALYRIHQGCGCAICMAETSGARPPDRWCMSSQRYMEAFEVCVTSKASCTPCPKPDLNILRAIRQIHEEAFRVLWNTNIFSFNLPFALEQFIESLNPIQRGKLAKLHISTIIDLKFEPAWDALLGDYLIQKLPALKSLNVCLKPSTLHEGYYNGMSDLTSNTIRSLLGLQQFPLTSMNIILDRNVSWDWLRFLFEKSGSPYRGLLQPPVGQEHISGSDSGRRKLECLLAAYFLKHPKADEVAAEFMRKMEAER